jgi:hypothetical protein
MGAFLSGGRRIVGAEVSVGNPVMCIECGILHGHHQPSCGRREWEAFKRRLNAIMCELPVANPGRVRSRILREAEAEAFKRFDPKVAAEFMQAMSEEYNDV